MISWQVFLYGSCFLTSTYPTIKFNYFFDNQRVIFRHSSWAHIILLHNETGESWFWAAVALFDVQHKRQSTSTFFNKVDFEQQWLCLMYNVNGNQHPLLGTKLILLSSSGSAKTDWSFLPVLLTYSKIWIEL